MVSLMNRFCMNITVRLTQSVTHYSASVCGRTVVAALMRNARQSVSRSNPDVGGVRRPSAVACRSPFTGQLSFSSPAGILLISEVVCAPSTSPALTS